ncbi:MAG: hypothetical protein PVG63_07020, partial [Anaerolineales bacterium]
MNLAPLLPEIQRLPAFKQLVQDLSGHQNPLLSLPLPRSVRTALLAGLANALPGPLVYVTARVDRAHTVAEELAAWDPKLEALPFPEPDALFYELASWGDRALRRRMTVLAKLTQNQQPGSPTPDVDSNNFLILTTARAMMTHTLSSRDVFGNSRWVKAG